MAFNPRELIKLGGGLADGQTAWLYRTTDAMSAVDNTDYFIEARNLGMRVGDPVTVIKTDGPNRYETFVAALDSDGNATVTAGTEIT